MIITKKYQYVSWTLNNTNMEKGNRYPCISSNLFFFADMKGLVGLKDELNISKSI